MMENNRGALPDRADILISEGEKEVASLTYYLDIKEHGDSEAASGRPAAAAAAAAPAPAAATGQSMGGTKQQQPQKRVPATPAGMAGGDASNESASSVDSASSVNVPHGYEAMAGWLEATGGGLKHLPKLVEAELNDSVASLTARGLLPESALRDALLVAGLPLGPATAVARLAASQHSTFDG